jgi:hypothetical protein
MTPETAIPDNKSRAIAHPMERNGFKVRIHSIISWAKNMLIMILAKTVQETA